MNEDWNQMNKQEEYLYDNEDHIRSPVIHEPSPVSALDVKSLELQIEQLKKDIACLRNDLEYEQDQRFKCEAEREKKEMECVRLNHLIEKNKIETKDLREENAKINSMENRNGVLSNQNACLDDKVKYLEKNLEEKIINLEQLTNINTDLEEKIQEFKRQSHEDRSNIEKLQNDLHENKSVFSLLEQQLFDKDQQLHMFGKNIQALSEEKSSLMEELNQLRLAPDIMNTTPGECMSVITDMKIAELNEEIDEMTKSWMCPKDVEDLKKQYEKLQEDFQEQGKYLIDAKQSTAVVEQQKLDLFEELNKSAQAMAEKEKHVSLLLSQIDSLKVELKAVGDELANISIKLDLNEEMHQRMRKEILSEKALNENLNMELQKSNKLLCEKEEEIEDFKMNYELSVKENESLSTQIKDFTSDRADILLQSNAEKQELISKYQQVLNENTNLSTKLVDVEEDWKKKKEEMLKNHQLTINQNLSLAIELDKMRSEFATAKQALIKENGDLLNVYKESIERNDLLNKELECLKEKLKQVSTPQFIKPEKPDQISNSRNQFLNSTLKENQLPGYKPSVTSDQNNKYCVETCLLGGAHRTSAKTQYRQSSSAYGLSVVEEPDPPLSWTSLSLQRVAELQSRNSKQLAHLKSSYPTETQGKTPSRCDESVRVGDPRKTMLRITQMNNSVISNETMTENSKLHHDEFKKFENKEFLLGPPLKLAENFSSPPSHVEKKRTQPSTAFEIPITPQARKKTLKKTSEINTVSTRTRSRVCKPSKTSPLSTKKTKSIDFKKKVLLSSEKMRKPFSRLNLKK